MQSACLTYGDPQDWCLVLRGRDHLLGKNESPLELAQGYCLVELAEANHPGHMAVTVQLAMKQVLDLW